MWSTLMRLFRLAVVLIGASLLLGSCLPGCTAEDAENQAAEDEMMRESLDAMAEQDDDDSSEELIEPALPDTAVNQMVLLGPDFAPTSYEWEVEIDPEPVGDCPTHHTDRDTLIISTGADTEGATLRTVGMIFGTWPLDLGMISAPDIPTGNITRNGVDFTSRVFLRDWVFGPMAFEGVYEEWEMEGAGVEFGPGEGVCKLGFRFATYGEGYQLMLQAIEDSPERGLDAGMAEVVDCVATATEITATWRLDGVDDGDPLVGSAASSKGGNSLSLGDSVATDGEVVTRFDHSKTDGAVSDVWMSLYRGSFRIGSGGCE